MKKASAWVIGLILLSFALVGLFLTVAPEQIPVHYNIQGEIDRWGSKYEFLLFPLLSAVSGGVMTLVGRSVRKKGEEFSEKVVNALNIWMLVLFNGIWGFFLVKALEGTNMTGKLPALGTKVLFMMILMSFIPVGNLMPKVRRNSVLGLRTKWSMADDVCWQKSQRFGGFLLVGAGVLGAALVSLAPVAWCGYIVIGLMLIVTAAAVIGSYRVYRNVHP